MASIAQTVVSARYRGRELNLSAWFRDTGDEMIVFVHGLGCSKESWRSAWSQPALSGRSLLAIDLPGFGSSPRPVDFSYRLEHLAGLLGSIIDSYASRRITLVAHSMGGAIALLLPRGGEKRVEGLVLVEGRLVKSSCGIAAEAASSGFEKFVSVNYPRFVRRTGADPRAAFDLQRADPEAFYRTSCSLIDWIGEQELVRRFDAMACPKVFVHGDANRHLEELAVLPSDCLIEISDAGHFVMNDNSGAFYQFLSAWPAHRRPPVS